MEAILLAYALFVAWTLSVLLVGIMIGQRISAVRRYSVPTIEQIRGRMKRQKFYAAMVDEGCKSRERYRAILDPKEG